MSKKLTKELIKYITNETERIEYGKVIIELRETSDKIDIITEERHRFSKTVKTIST